MEEFKPEEKAEIILWDWLKTKGQSVEEVYYNRDNKLGWKTFFVKGIQKRPDFIVAINDGFGMKYLAIEIKSSDKSKNILDANKILDYWDYYVKGETKYYLTENNQEIKITHFLIATNDSIKGYLFKDETLIDNFASDSKSKRYVASIGLIPRYEGHRTFELIRSLWNTYSKFRKQYEERCGIGILIADVADNFFPKIMITFYSENKRRWSQRWWRV